MTKIVYNACHGGFGLSDRAVHRYAELNGLTLYPEQTMGITIWWTAPLEDRAGILEGEAFYKASIEDRKRSNELHRKLSLSPDRIERTDPILIHVVEELGDEAGGRFAKLLIEELPEGTEYRIDEYDGFESVETKESYEWRVA
jgi:hypothetical protein